MAQGFINPEFKANQGLGETDVAWAALKTKITDYLKTQAASSTVTVAAVRALDDKFGDDRVWNQIVSDLNLLEIPL